MSTPYLAEASIAKPTTNAVVLALKFPTRVFIHRVLTRQEAGAGAYTVDLFDQNPTEFATANPEEYHLVCPTITGASGKSATFFSPPVPFDNRDEPDAAGVRPRILYIRISGSITGTFYVAVAGSNDHV